jgi:hypothetical protein
MTLVEHVAGKLPINVLGNCNANCRPTNKIQANWQARFFEKWLGLNRFQNGEVQSLSLPIA